MKTIQAKAIISAADATGGVFDKIAQKIKGVEKTAKSLGNIQAPKFTGNMMEELRRLKLTEKELQGVRGSLANYDAALRAARPSFGQFVRAHQDFATKTVSHWRQVKAGIDEAAVAQKRFEAGNKHLLAGARNMVGRGFALAGGAYGAYRVGKAGVTAAATAQRESARDWYSGIKPEDTSRFEMAAKQTSGRFQSIDTNTLHEALRDTAHSTGQVNTAIELSDTIGGMLTVLQSLKGKDKAVDETRQFFKALDNLGRNVDPAQIKSLSDGYLKALGVEGADMSLRDVFTMAKRLKQAGATVSDRFLYTTGASMAMDMGADSAGNSIAMAMQQEVQATKQAKAYGQKMGLRDKSGKFIDRSKLMHDPDQWVWDNLPRAMKRAGLDYSKPEDVNTFLGSAFSNSSARYFVSKAATQEDQYRRKSGQYGQGKGLEGADELQRRDAFVAFEAVQAQLRNLASQKEAMDAAAKGLNQISSAVAQLGDAMEKGGWIKKAMEFAEQRFRNETRDAKTVWDSVGKPILDWDKRMGVNFGSVVPRWMGGPGTPYPQAEDPMRADEVQRSFPWADDPMGADYSRKAFHSKEYWGRKFPPVGQPSSPSFAVPGVSNTTTYGTGAPGDKAAASVQVQGTLEGEGKMQIEVMPGSSLLDVVRRVEAVIKMTGRINENGPGSTGVSSPDAGAPGGTGFSGVY